MRTVLLAFTSLLLACGPTGGRTTDGGNEGDGVPPKMDACTGLQCRQVDCASMGLPPTTVSGTAYAPNETLKLYGVTVYVPNLAPGPFTDGVKCDRCDPNLPGEPITRGLSDEMGNFQLTNVPVGSDIPLVLTVGKWRRVVTIPNVTQCTDNPLPANLTRLPRNKTEGDLPKIAIVSGGCDGFECLVKKLGVSNGEFSNDAGTGRVHIYAGSGGLSTVAGATPQPVAASTTLMTDLDKLKEYDMAFFACECSESPGNKPQPTLDNIKAYADAGGRIFLSHYNHHWLHGTGSGTTQALWSGMASCTTDGYEDFTLTIDQMDNPKGMSFAEWMVAVGGSTANGQITQLSGTGRQSCASIASETEQWAFAPGNIPAMFQFTTPVEAPPPDRCGKVVFSDMHVSSDSGTNFPSASDGCNGELSAQEKALAFMFFDIATCVDVIAREE